MYPVRSLVWKCALVFASVRCRFFLGFQGKDRDPRAHREVRFRNILNLACHTDRSRMLWQMRSNRKQRPREAPIRKACSRTRRDRLPAVFDLHHSHFPRHVAGSLSIRFRPQWVATASSRWKTITPSHHPDAGYVARSRVQWCLNLRL